MTKEEIDELIEAIVLLYKKNGDKEKFRNIINKYMKNTKLGDKILSCDNLSDGFEDYSEEFADYIKKLIPKDLMEYYIEKCVESGIDEELLYHEMSEVKSLENAEDDEKIEELDKIKPLKWKIRIITTIKDKEKILEALDKLKPEEVIKFRQSLNVDIAFIKEHIDFFIKKEGFEGKVDLDLIHRMQEKNESFYLNADFRILDKKYIKLLGGDEIGGDRIGEDRINFITCYPIIQQKFLELKDTELIVLCKCINEYMTRNKTEDWTVLFDTILTNISEGKYNELFDNIRNNGDLSNVDIHTLIQILQDDENWCGIKDIEGVKTFDTIRQEKCSKKIESGKSIVEKKDALLQKIFGHNLEFAKKIIKRYGADIENIPDGEIKDYVRCLKEIERIEDEGILKKIFDGCKFVEIDKISLERKIITEYGDMYKEGLYEPKDSDLDEELSDQDIKVYNAGVNFKILLHVPSGIEGKKGWNIPKMDVKHFCASYIRNDMMGSFGRKSCYSIWVF